ncbi:MAG: hypothetical protein HYU43_03970 [Armatimonadetes bacterium]|nr:hypothetical protein [Armatimonadota bacterium]MBI2247241.1 hypothetical protein [Armatimonadota bacterium]MBI2973748.1 hypothetical protein [Armatimonadota bacterium]
MALADYLRFDRADRVGGNGSRVTASRDAPSTLFELVGIVLDPEIHPVTPQAPGTFQDLRPRLLLKKTA